MTGSFNDEWEAEHQRRAWGAWPCEAVVRYVMTELRRHTDNGERMGQEFLDLGCGAGAVSRFLRSLAVGVTAIDGSPTAVARARTMMIDENLHRRFRADVGDVTRLPYGDGIFDFVLDVACLQYLNNDQLRTAISEIARVLKPGGRFFSRHASSVGWAGIHTVGICYPRYKFDIKEIYGQHFNVETLHELVERLNPSGRPKPRYVTIAHWNIEGVKK